MTCVIVLGCYRSGTSAVAGILHHSGVFMGRDFDPPAEANRRGFFEDLEFKRLFSMQVDGRDVDTLTDVLIRVRETGHHVWGVKDPQLCLTAGRFVRLLDERGSKHKVVSVCRPAADVRRSLAKAMPMTSESDWTALVDEFLARKRRFLDEYRGEVLDVLYPDVDAARIAAFASVPLTDAAATFFSSIS